MKTNNTMKTLAIILVIVAAAAACYFLARCAVKPVDGPGMERNHVDSDSVHVAGHAHDSISATPNADNAEGIFDVNAVYEARIKGGEVYVDFNTDLCNRLAEEKLGSPCNILKKSNKVEGLGGKCVEALKCIANYGYAGVGDPFLVMLTAGGEVYVLSIVEAIEEGDMTCGRCLNLDAGRLKGRKVKAIKRIDSSKEGEDHGAVAVLDNGEQRYIDICQEWGYYVVKGGGCVVHLSRDWCFTVDDKERSASNHISGLFATKHETDNSFTFYTDKGVDMRLDVDWEGDNMLVKAFTLSYNEQRYKLPITSGARATGVERLFNNPWDWGYFQYNK